ncbi:uncharacterized protein LOC115534868 [Gadus morhua]|uniref:uncharacterized protein LOC115534868 n=1 Tax=Gadus morhua TaxID=8049 RepID=UPI0011B7D1F2|nr:uncharacterized protein LOC115534868 [Gadus morhua]
MQSKHTQTNHNHSESVFATWSSKHNLHKHIQTKHYTSERSSQQQPSSKDLNINTNHTHTERSSQQQPNIKAPINTNTTYNKRWNYSSRGSAGYSSPVDRGPGSPHSLAQKERKQEAKGHHNHSVGDPTTGLNSIRDTLPVIGGLHDQHLSVDGDQGGGPTYASIVLPEGQRSVATAQVEDDSSDAVTYSSVRASPRGGEKAGDVDVHYATVNKQAK